MRLPAGGDFVQCPLGKAAAEGTVDVRNTEGNVPRRIERDRRRLHPGNGLAQRV
jgi:hypothetical protein